MNELDIARAGQLRAHGYLILRGHVDPVPLRAELDRTLDDAFATRRHQRGPAGNEFRYVPAMCERTPVSIDLVRRLATLAESLLSAPVLPTRAKVTAYLGATGWHHDSALPVRSIGVLAYLDALDASTGALQVRRGSHVRDVEPEACPLVVLATDPGDVIVLDEHLWHASSGGGERRQWRVDYVADEGREEDLREYYRAQYAPGWDGGYDAERYPTYGPTWRGVDARWSERLEALGAFALADAEEAHMRAVRLRRGGDGDADGEA
jgi:hypothetical protein